MQRSLESRLGNSAIVTYSAAAFLKKQELFENAKNSTIIRNSNFVRPSFLHNHSKYTFISAGHGGFANAEPEKVSDIPFEAKMLELDRNDVTFLIVFAKRAKLSKQ